MLAHYGAQGVLSRTLMPKAEIKIVFLGCLLPDIPWIFLRIINLVAPHLDPIPARLYAIGQGSLFVTLFLCGSIAAISARPKRIFGILAFNVLLHFLLDALQTKWANGVHFFAPISWELINFELFWPESLPTYGLTLLGLFYACWLWRKAIDEPLILPRLSVKKVGWSLALLVMYLVLPIFFLQGPYLADNHSIKTIMTKEERTGHDVEFDRSHYKKNENGDFLISFLEEKLGILNNHLDHSGEYSIRARFVDSQTIEILEFHEHIQGFRGHQFVCSTYPAQCDVGVWHGSESGLQERYALSNSRFIPQLKKFYGMKRSKSTYET